MSYFCLGITQLDEQTSKKNLNVEGAMPTLDDNYPPINFISDIFYYKDKYFCKNRFKHHNDAMMKKLRKNQQINLKKWWRYLQKEKLKRVRLNGLHQRYTKKYIQYYFASDTF